MAQLDHSLTYREAKFRNVPHIIRLKAILRRMPELVATLPATVSQPSYADLGCSNGFITQKIAELINAGTVVGMDHNDDNLTVARERYPHINFATVDLNLRATAVERFDVVTCFETLEHVGNIEHAVANIINRLNDQGVGLIVVPIEIGKIGLLKFAVKTCYGYDLAELNRSSQVTRWRYLTHLVTGKGRMSAFRAPDAPGWGTHFGFDYRDVEDALDRSGCRYSGYRVGFNMFYEIRVV